MNFNWIYLKDMDPETLIRRGSILKFKDTVFNEDLVLIITEWRIDPEYPIALVRLTGSKAAINPVQNLPRISIGNGGLSVKWLMDNWNDWVWLDSDIIDVRICLAPIDVKIFD